MGLVMEDMLFILREPVTADKWAALEFKSLSKLDLFRY
jgi:hypothetical protein